MPTLATQRALRELPQADETRARVLSAAEAVFAERGYAGATTREIAERAGIGKRMLFYYFPTKDAVYRAVLERIIVGLCSIYEHTRGEPGPIGMADGVDQLTLFAASHLTAMKVWMREVMDGGPHLEDLTRRYLAPLWERAGNGVARNMASGAFRTGDPMHVLVNVGGVTLFYFLIAPMLRLIWERDPLDPMVLGERAAAARDCLLHGLAGPAKSKEGMP